MHTTTFFTLMAEFGQAHIPITVIGKKFFGYDDMTSKNNATKGKFPFPVFRAGGQKSEWLVDIADLADYLDKVKAQAKKEFKLAKE